MAGKHIAYLVQMALSKRDYDRFGFAEMIAHGARITVIDVSNIVMDKAVRYEDYADFPDFDVLIASPGDDLKAVEHRLAAADLVVCHVGSGFVYQKNYAVLRALCRAGTPYVLSSNNAVPTWSTDTSAKMLKHRLTSMRPITTLLNRLPIWALRLRPADFIILGGEKSRIKRRLVTNSTREIWVHSNDYEVFRDALEKPAPTPDNDDIAVFIDQNLGFHPGAKVKGGQNAVDPNFFYPRLRALFDRVERELGLRVVVSAHPRADYSERPGLFGDREVVPNETVSLVRRAKLALCSYSTAASLAVLFRVPLFIFTVPSISTVRYLSKDAPGTLSKAIGTRLHDISDPAAVDLDDALAIDEDAYDAFVRAYIKRPGSPPDFFWKAVLDVA